MSKTFSSAENILYKHIYESSVLSFSSIMWSTDQCDDCWTALLMLKNSENHICSWEKTCCRFSEMLKFSSLLLQNLKTVFILKTWACDVIIFQMNYYEDTTVTQKFCSNSKLSSSLQILILKSLREEQLNKIWLLLELQLTAKNEHTKSKDWL